MANGRKMIYSDSVVVDAAKLQWHIQRHCMAKSRFADKMCIGRTSLYRMLNGEAVRRSSVAELAKRLSITTDDLLPIESVERAVTATEPWNHPEWELVPGSLNSYVTMSNGLVMRAGKVRHRFFEQEFGRAKLFDISGMPPAVQSGCHKAMTRHALVCRKLSSCDQIAQNLTMTSSADGCLWTSVDRWFEGMSLDDIPRLSKSQLWAVMIGIGQAIKAMHAADIVARELAPQRILVNDEHRVLVTDLELAKLLSLEGTVSSRWVANPYRAPEVTAGETSPQADLYSFAQIYLDLAASSSPKPIEQLEGVDRLAVLVSPAALRTLLRACLHPVWQSRPQSIEPILRILEGGL